MYTYKMKRKLSLQSLAVVKYMLERPKDDVFGLELIEAVQLPAGTIYPILTRLEDAGWIEGEWESLDRKDAGRRRRKYYKLTKDGKKDGRKQLKDSLKALERLGLFEKKK